MKLIVRNFLLPKLYSGNNDISKKWFVYFSVIDKKTGKLKRITIFSGLNNGDQKARHYKADKIIKYYSEKLRSGWNPLNEVETYSDILFTRLEARKKEKQVDYSIRYWINEFWKSNTSDFRKKTIQCRTVKYRVFVDWCETNKLNTSNFTSKHEISFCEYLINTRKLGSVTFNGYLNILKTFFTFCKTKGLVNEIFFAGQKRRKENNTGLLPFSKLQQAILKEAIPKKDPQLWLFCQFEFYCAIRTSELRQLKISDIDVWDGKIIVRSEIAKNRKTQFVALPIQLQKVLLDMKINNENPDHYVFTRKGIPGIKMVGLNHFGNIHRKVLKEVGIKGRYGLYSWKHTGAVESYMAGLGLKHIKEQLRHHSLDMTDIYLKSLGVMDLDDIKNKYPDL